jgi:hypothetical protein
MLNRPTRYLHYTLFFFKLSREWSIWCSVLNRDQPFPRRHQTAVTKEVLKRDNRQYWSTLNIRDEVKFVVQSRPGAGACTMYCSLPVLTECPRFRVNVSLYSHGSNRVFISFRCLTIGKEWKHGPPFLAPPDLMYARTDHANSCS